MHIPVVPSKRVQCMYCRKLKYPHNYKLHDIKLQFQNLELRYLYFLEEEGLQRVTVYGDIF